MEIYFKNEKGQLEQTTLYDLLQNNLSESFEMNNGCFADENYRWIGIVQEKQDKQITVNMAFNTSEDIITDVSVYSAETKKVVDEDNMIKLI